MNQWMGPVTQEPDISVGAVQTVRPALVTRFLKPYPLPALVVAQRAGCDTTHRNGCSLLIDAVSRHPLPEYSLRLTDRLTVSNDVL